MEGEINTWDKPLVSGQGFDNISSDRRDFVHKIAIDPEEIPKKRGHSKGNVLPDGIREGIEAIFDPVISSFFTAGWTESGFARMRCLNGFTTGITDKEMVTEETCSTDEEF